MCIQLQVYYLPYIFSYYRDKFACKKLMKAIIVLGLSFAAILGQYILNWLHENLGSYSQHFDAPTELILLCLTAVCVNEGTVLKNNVIAEESNRVAKITSLLQV